jgi:PTS system nitrogen regulatory IIA component
MTHYNEPLNFYDVSLMNLLAKLLPATNIALNIDVSSKKRVFEYASILFENNQGIERSKVFDSLLARERLGSTGLGQGVAIPHGRIKGLKDAVTGVVTLAQPVAFDAPDALPVKLLVFLLVPEQATQQHLELLSELAELLSDKAIREMLKAASTAADVTRIIQEWQPESRQS